VSDSLFPCLSSSEVQTSEEERRGKDELLWRSHYLSDSSYQLNSNKVKNDPNFNSIILLLAISEAGFLNSATRKNVANVEEFSTY